MSSTFALARLAYRTAARNKLRSLLVFALIALLVAAGTTFSTIARSVIATDDDFAAATLGGADALVEIGSHIGGVVPTGRYLSTVQVAESGAVVSWGATAPIETKQVPDWLAGFDADSYASSITAEFGGVVNASRSWPGVSRWRDPQPFLGAASAPRLLLDIDMQDPQPRPPRWSSPRTSLATRAWESAMKSSLGTRPSRWLELQCSRQSISTVRPS